MVTMNRNKVVIVGTGQVGSTAAFAIVTHGLCNELVLIDHSAGKALGESHDLDDGSEFQDRHVKVRNGDYGDCKDADIVVITVGRKPPANSTRLDELGFTIGLVGDVVGSWHPGSTASSSWSPTRSTSWHGTRGNAPACRAPRCWAREPRWTPRVSRPSSVRRPGWTRATSAVS